MREPPFEHSPDARPRTLAELVGIANAIEQESVRRYALLVQNMTLRGEVATAAALRVMLDEERKHLDAVAHWAASIGQSLPSGDKFKRSVPADLWKAWDEAAGSAQLTPYRAFAIAADSEQRPSRSTATSPPKRPTPEFAHRPNNSHSKSCATPR